MTNVWFVREDYEPPIGAPAYEDLSVKQCIELLGLAKTHWYHGLDLTLRFGCRNPHPAAVLQPRHVVCQIDEPEASEHGWRTGYYLLELSPKEVAERLEPPEVG